MIGLESTGRTDRRGRPTLPAVLVDLVPRQPRRCVYYSARRAGLLSRPMNQSATTRPSITAFFPCYGDAGTIASMVIVADRTLRDLTDDYEIVVVNDASP